MQEEEKVIFFTTHCPACEALEQKFKMHGIKYTVNDDIRTMFAMGFTHVPMVVVGDKVMDFKESLKWLEERKSDNRR